MNIPCDPTMDSGSGGWSKGNCWGWDYSVSQHRVNCFITFTGTGCQCKERTIRDKFGCCRNGPGCSLNTCWTNENVMLDASGIPQLPNNGELVPCCESEINDFNECLPSCTNPTFGFGDVSNRILSGPSRHSSAFL